MVFKAETILFSERVDTSNVTDMSRMFRHAKVEKLDLSSFNTSNVRDFTDMFKGTETHSGYTKNQVE